MTPAPIAPHISVDVVSMSTDPLMRSATSLLLMLGRLRSSMSQANPAELMDQVAQALAVFEREARAAGAPADQVQTAKFALAATADDIVQNNPNLDPRIWSQYSMEVRFLGTRLGGVKFFDELKRAKENASLNVGLLELMHACLSLGFEGKYRATGNFGELQAVRRDLYEAIRRNRAKTIEDLSPHWRGQPIALAGSRFQIPIWAVASVALALLLVVYIALRWMLGNAEDALLNHISFPHDLVAIARAAPVKPPPDPPKSAMTECQRITGALADDILAGQACVRPDRDPHRASHRQRDAVRKSRRDRQPKLPADGQKDRRGAGQGAWPDFHRRLHRFRSDQDGPIPLQLRIISGARRRCGEGHESRLGQAGSRCGLGESRHQSDRA